MFYCMECQHVAVLYCCLTDLINESQVYLLFYYCSCNAQLTNGTDVFIINDFAIIQLSTSKKVSSDFENKHFSINIVITWPSALVTNQVSKGRREQPHKHITYYF